MDAFERRLLGRTGMALSALGLGGAPLGDGFERLPEEQALATIDAAYSDGLNLFDTSPLYGYGLSEHRFGHVLRNKPRNTFVLSTKVGRYFLPPAAKGIDRGIWAGTLEFNPVLDYSYDGTLRSIEQSLMRLGISSIDILFIHDVDTMMLGSDQAFEATFRQAVEGAYKALEDLRRQGVVRAIGAGLNDVPSCLRFLDVADLDCFLLAGRYTLLDQDALDALLPRCTEREIGIILGGPFNSGILATGAIAGARYNYVAAPSNVLARVAAIEAICMRHDVALPAAALQFPLAHPTIASVIPGAVKPEEVRRNEQLLAARIPTDFWTDLKDKGLLRPDAPTPNASRSL